jgi:antitoxin HicB
MLYAYPATLTAGPDGVSVAFADVPEALTHGATREEALAHAVDALETGLSFYIDERRALPAPSKARRGQVMVEASPLAQAKLALYDTMRRSGVGKAELARRLVCHMPQIDRLLDLTHASKMEALSRALAALGKRLVVEVRDAA